jgi:L-threonylcarbamoyladenylate synthase
MEILPIDPMAPEPKAVRVAAEAVLRGGVVAFPTDTVYGLSCSLMDPSAVEFLYRLKRRPSHLSVIALIPDADAVHPLVDSVPDAAEALMQRFWPGPLSIIFPASPLVPLRVRGERGTIALRVPRHPLCLALLDAVGGPLVSSSANLSGQAPCVDAVELVRVFGNQIDVILDGGRVEGSAPSTVVDVSAGRVELVRAGAVDVAGLTDSPGG